MTSVHPACQLHVVLKSDPRSGGEGLAAVCYSQAIARAGGRILLLSNDAPSKPVIEMVGGGSFEHLAVPQSRCLVWTLFRQYLYIRNLCVDRQVDLIHVHGMWSPLLAIAGLVARRRHIKLVISPHGGLEPAALQYKWLKKLLALKTYQGWLLRVAELYVATAEHEMGGLRKLGIRQPVAVIPNGVDVTGAWKRDRSCRSRRTFLFLSRLHPIKGLDDLIEAWSMVRRPDWRFVIAGDGDAGYRARIEALIRAKGIEDDFQFAGFVEGERKQACFDDADVFVLPTHSENFGIAVAEALANALPVITTKGAPWADLVEHHCGWWVEPGVSGVSQALASAMECGNDTLREMGRRGRLLVMEKYSWEQIGTTALEVATWLLQPSRLKPNVVRLYGE